MARGRSRRRRIARTQSVTRVQADGASVPAREASRLALAAILLALVAATLAVYQPAWHGELLWDDAQHVTPPELRTLDGLRRIWFEPAATQQYYPLLHSAFWLQHRLWGDNTLGYHIVNIVLHAVAAFLVGLILRRLAVPGAWLAAAIFALHPVHVESVAWITELKNTLSGALGLAAVLVYLEFDRSRRKRSYVVAAGLFVLALLSKTVTAMLPVMLIAALWWQRGRVTWRRDVRPLAPFLIAGAVAGLTTAWIERTDIGARGPWFDFTWIERVLIAGRALWFYVGKLVWPANLAFTYPRWQVSQATWWHYLYPLAAAGALGAAWMLRARTRTPLAVAFAYTAALFPVLGFFNVFPFRFSFVADHFQYLASIPVIAVAAAVVVRLLSRAEIPRPAAGVAAAALLLVLSALSFLESREYKDPRTLHEATLRTNPRSWLAHLYLGIYEAPENLEKAVEHFKAALEIEPDLGEGHFNLGLAYQRMGRLEDAVASYERAARTEIRRGETQRNLCTVLRALGRLPEALAACRRAVEVEPGSVQAQLGLGVTLHNMGRLEEALEPLARAAHLGPGEAEVFKELGNVLQGLDRLEDAEASYREALRINPRFPEALAGLGFLSFRQGRVDQAIRLYREALRLRPNYADALYYLGNALQAEMRFEEAVEQYLRALEVNPADAAVHNNLGRALEEVGRSGEAVAHYKEALRLRPDLQQARDNLERVGSRR